MLDPFGVPINPNDPNSQQFHQNQQPNNYYGPQFGVNGSRPENIPSLEETTGGYSGFGKNSFASKKRDLFDSFYSMINTSLLSFKLFYFFFYAAFGSIFPLISVYFKQLGMSAIQTGILGGLRQLIEALIVPFWCHIADKWKRAKQIFIASLVISLLFTISIGFVRPRPEGCLVEFNVKPHPFAVHKPYMFNYYDKRPDMLKSVPMQNTEKMIIGKSPLDLRKDNLSSFDTIKDLFEREYDDGQFDVKAYFVDIDNYSNKTLVMPLYSTVIYSRSNIYLAFALLIFLTVCGEIFTSPAIPLADVAVTQYLGEEFKGDLYRQKVFGSIGVALAMFSIGLALDHSNIFPDHPCLQSGVRERNYMICFTLYTLFMILTLIFSFRFNFYSEGDQESMHFKLFKDKLAKIFFKRQTKARSKLVNEDDPTETQDDYEDEETKRALAQERIFEEREEKLNMEFDINDPMAVSHLRFTKWPKVFGEFRRTRMIIFIIVVIYMGMGIGLVFTFLFWHLQEFKGSPTLFGIASMINHISEICAMYFLRSLMQKIGCVNLILLGLMSNVFRFLYVSWLSDPWWILPVEFLQGLTHSGIMTAVCAYVGENFERHKHKEVLGFIRGLHIGIGRFLGSVLGGILTAYFGSSIMFRTYGLISLAVMAFFFLSEMFLAKKKAQTDVTDPGQMENCQTSNMNDPTDYNDYQQTSTGF